MNGHMDNGENSTFLAGIITKSLKCPHFQWEGYFVSVTSFVSRVSNLVFTETEKPGNPGFLKTVKPVFGCL